MTYKKQATGGKSVKLASLFDCYANQYSQDRNITKPINPMASSAVFAVSPMWMEENNFFIKKF
jgi:hypothetical protein